MFCMLLCYYVTMLCFFTRWAPDHSFRVRSLNLRIHTKWDNFELLLLLFKRMHGGTFSWRKCGKILKTFEKTWNALEKDWIEAKKINVKLALWKHLMKTSYANILIMKTSDENSLWFEKMWKYDARFERCEQMWRYVKICDNLWTCVKINRYICENVKYYYLFLSFSFYL